MDKRLSLKKELLCELGSEEMGLLAGGTPGTLNSCNTIVCITIFTCAGPACIVNTFDIRCVRTLQESICICA